MKILHNYALVFNCVCYETFNYKLQHLSYLHFTLDCSWTCSSSMKSGATFEELLLSMCWKLCLSGVCAVKANKQGHTTLHDTTRHDATRLRKAFVILIASLVIWIDFYTASSNTATSSRSQLTKVQGKQNTTMRRTLHLIATETWNSKSHLTVIGFSSF